MKAVSAVALSLVGALSLGFSSAGHAQSPDAGTTGGAAAGKAPAAKAAPAKPAPGKAELTWWGHAAFVLRTPGGATLAIDPWFKNPKAPAGAAWPSEVDAILVTHGHSDHVGDAAELAAKTQAQVIGSHELVALIGAKNGVSMNVGGSIKVKDATIHIVEAVHSSGFGADPKALKYGGPATGFVIEIQGGPTLYHAGDTATFSSMQLIGERFKPTWALLPIGGHYTMDPKGAAVAARLLGAANIVPMHYGTMPQLAGTPAELTAELPRARAKSKVRNLEIGQPTPLGK